MPGLMRSDARGGQAHLSRDPPAPLAARAPLSHPLALCSGEVATGPGRSTDGGWAGASSVVGDREGDPHGPVGPCRRTRTSRELRATSDGGCKTRAKEQQRKTRRRKMTESPYASRGGSRGRGDLQDRRVSRRKRGSLSQNTRCRGSDTSVVLNCRTDKVCFRCRG